ncbi:MAG: LacI family DNA-binding transcriptional regulator [Saprospiraceae bacterium]|nr:LacI family DNA-binding transcriptional regulator [Saprospiraceae bacterium]
MNNITIKDIANALGISNSTVSRALRDSHEISEDTKAKVIAYAKAVNYHPNPIAQSLRENKSYSIGVIVPEIANNYFSEVINGIDSVASQHDYHVVIYQTHESYEREISTIQHVLSRKADGLIISLSLETNDYSHIHSAMEDNFPIIFFDRVPPIENCYKVVSDNYEGAYKATKHMIEKGKKRIAHITSPPVLSITRERLAGYKAALNDNNIEVDEQLIRYCGFEPKDAFETIDELIKNQKPDSIFVCSDRLALNCLEAIKNNPSEESKDLGLIGYTNLKTANLLYTPLSTIRQPAFEMGVRAAELLIKILESKNRKVEFQTITLKNELLIR